MELRKRARVTQSTRGSYLSHKYDKNGSTKWIFLNTDINRKATAKAANFINMMNTQTHILAHYIWMKTKWPASFLEIHNPALTTDIMMNISQFTSRFKANLDKEDTLFTLSKALFPTYIVFFLWVIIFKCNWIEDMLITHNSIKEMSFYQRIFNFSESQSVLYSIKTGNIWTRGMLEPFLNIVIFIPL